MTELDQVADIAQEAAAIALRDWREGEAQSNVWEKSPGQVVCDSDLAVDQFLRAELSRLRPEAGWLSEETVEDESRQAKSLAWVVDPIDGTRDFVRGRRGWCVSVALVEDGDPVLGVLVAPARGEVWTAVSGEGAMRNGTRLTGSQRTELAGARLPVDDLRKGSQLVAVPKPNSIALRMAMIAADEADVVLAMRWGHEWDIAAAHCLMAETGGIVTDGLGGALRYNGSTGKALGIAASAPAIHADAVQMTRTYLEKKHD